MDFLERLMPELAGAPPRVRAAARGAGAVMLLALALHVAHTAAGLGGTAFADALQAVGLVAVVIALVLRRPTAPEDRRSWRALTTAVAAWAAGALWSAASASSGTAVGAPDALWLLFYPFAYLAIGLRTRATLQRLTRSPWLDGVIGLLSVGALGWIVVVAPILEHAPGHRLEAVVNAAYVIGDLVLVALTVAAIGVRGWRPGRAWGLLAAGLAVFASADSLWLLRSVTGTYAPGTPTDSMWGLGLLLMALAAWQPSQRSQRTVASLAVLAAPFAFSLASLGVLVY